MSNTIRPLSSIPLADGNGSTAPSAPVGIPGTASQPSPSQGSVAQNESVTLSEAAQTSTALLNAARGSAGIDQPNIAAIKAALANGSYNVSPEELGQAILTVLNETQP